ncbi:MAG: type II toxin-antitoxin system Phd/YefM family antitoxin [Chloroflexi bacterium]|nr:type II toxin-antitoxin system Phd/YefM family antitoxin [Chloroflexota bacterium]
MRDHIEPYPPEPSERVVGIRELKTHAASILRRVREERASYIVTHRGRAAGVILPLDEAAEISPASGATDPAAAWTAFIRAGRRLERRFRPAVSGVKLLSAMRR